MKISNLNIKEEEIFQWQTLDQIQTVPNSSCALSKPHGWMESMLSLVELLMELKL